VLHRSPVPAASIDHDQDCVVDLREKRAIGDWPLASGQLRREGISICVDTEAAAPYQAARAAIVIAATTTSHEDRVQSLTI
jgi:hypothetical protein